MIGSYKSGSLAALSFLLLACQSKNDKGLQERVDLLEAELVTRNETISQLRREISEREQSSAETTIDLDRAKSTYTAMIEQVRDGLQATLGNQGKVTSATIAPILAPDSEYPVSSQVIFALTTAAGKSEVVIPVQANATGAWRIPQAEDYAKFLKSAKTTTPTVAATPNRPAPQQEEPRDVMGAQKTEKVTWGDEAAPPTQQRPDPAPQTPTIPKKVLPSSRDEIIDFGDP
jgi:hypothetical protein